MGAKSSRVGAAGEDERERDSAWRVEADRDVERERDSSEADDEVMRFSGT